MNAALNSADGQDLYLMGELAMVAEQSGLLPGRDQVYDFTISPVLGAQVDVSNIGAIDFAVGVNIAGQLHDRVHGPPPGTAISRVTIQDDSRLHLST